MKKLNFKKNPLTAETFAPFFKKYPSRPIFSPQFTPLTSKYKQMHKYSK